MFAVLDKYILGADALPPTLDDIFPAQITFSLASIVIAVLVALSSIPVEVKLLIVPPSILLPDRPLSAIKLSI